MLYMNNVVTTPVLKHGPRSRTLLHAETFIEKAYSSNYVRTRKVVNYSCEGISQGKP